MACLMTHSAGVPSAGDEYRSDGNGLEHASHGSEKRKIASFGSPSDLVEPANGGGLEARFGGVVVRVDHRNFQLDGVLPALDPTFSFFASFAHGCSISKIDCHQLRPAARR